MEGNGTEVTQKIRSLITNKLVELGVYVDEELPDYIMVMVANKKSKIHMSDDLMLFLGNHTTLFTNWLNGILESLPSSVCDKKSSVPQKLSHSVAERSPLAPEEIAPSDERAPPTEEMEEMFSFKEEEADDFLSDELNRESAPPPPAEERVVVQTESANSTREDSKMSSSSSKSGIHYPTSVVKSSEGKVPLCEQRRNVVSSRVAAKVRPMVQNRLAYDEEEDEYDPRNPAVGSVASVVRVTERKWNSTSPALQANKLLLLKAMEDANRSVKKTGSVRRPAPVEPYRPTPIPQLTREENAVILDEPDLRLFLKGRTEGSHVVVGPSLPPPRAIKRKADQLQPNEMEISPKFVVTLDGIDPTKLVRDVITTCTSERTIRDEEDEEEEEDLDEELEEAGGGGGEVKLMERCRYWPACRNGDSCTRQHPTVPCKSFPNCRFGDKCLYIHPNCRFDSGCSRKDCPYTHASKRLLPQARLPSIALVATHSMKKKTVCKYFPNCTTFGCVYLHPKLCRFGGQCRAPNCPFGHPLPSPEKMKWVARPPS